MAFKKDYINYLLYTVVNSSQYEFTENYRLRKLVDSITAIDDVMKITYLIGKTAGLESLFKYLLYISDKIDKSQVTIFNLKDNFEYDKINIAKICRKISEYQSESVQDAIQNISEEKAEIAESREGTGYDKVTEDEPDEQDKGEMTAESNITEIDSLEGQGEEPDNEEGSGLTLIENVESYTGEAEVFELDSISESVENSGEEITKESIEDPEIEINRKKETTEEDNLAGDEESGSYETDTIDKEILSSDADEPESIENETDEIEEAGEVENERVFDTETDDLPDIEIEVHKPLGAAKDEELVKEEAITNEAYYTFETKFFEEVKILEKLLATVDRDCRTDQAGKLSEKCLQSLTEIIGITSELSNLSRQLSFDLIADIFFTKNMYFTKAISQPEILTGERIKLLDSSLALVNSLIKGEDYLNYDTIVDKIENLKREITKSPEAKPEMIAHKNEQEVNSEEIPYEEHEKEQIAESIEDTQTGIASEEKEKISEEKNIVKPARVGRQAITERPALKQNQIESANFKLKYLIKEFEKSFTAIADLKGEYSKFDAIEKISELNNALRLIAKIAASIKLPDVLKLAEVTYVFLKYVKDYRMDLQEPEIKQIVKYIIFTFKMLLTNRKPEDFNLLVQHLNNPVKIFADS